MAAANYDRIPLSGSTDGRGITVAGTAIGSGTTIHTATSGSSAGLGDLVTLYAYNKDTQVRTLVLGWGGTSDPGDLITQDVYPQGGLVLITANMLIRNSLVIKAACATASVIVLFGDVNRLS
jgi:hypothetical protein